MLERTLDRGPYITSWELAAVAADAIGLKSFLRVEVIVSYVELKKREEDAFFSEAFNL